MRRHSLAVDFSVKATSHKRLLCHRAASFKHSRFTYGSFLNNEATSRRGLSFRRTFCETRSYPRVKRSSAKTSRTLLDIVVDQCQRALNQRTAGTSETRESFLFLSPSKLSECLSRADTVRELEYLTDCYLGSDRLLL